MTRSVDSGAIRTLKSPFGKEIAAWQVNLDVYADRLDSDLLTTSEIRRGERMIRPLEARRFLASRHVLKIVLASYLDCSPERIHYRRSESGKLAATGANVKFSLSRSQGWAMIACSRRHPVGIDVEVLRSIPERDSMIESAFDEIEVQAFKKTSGADKDAMFLNAWVRKEACLKAIGAGLTVPLPQVIVGLESAKTITFIQNGESSYRVEVVSLESRDGTVAALATLLQS